MNILQKKISTHFFVRKIWQLSRLCLFIWIFALYAIETDFDCVVIGTSPICMLESIYRSHIGNRVLVIEKSAQCGGAWKSITVCGISNVDLGCHEYGGDPRVRKFLEEYIGCKIVENAPRSNQKGGGNYGIYPSRGCFELISKIENLLKNSGVMLLLNHKLDSVYIDQERLIAEIRVNGAIYTTKKILVSNGSDIRIDNFTSGYSHNKGRFPHLYLLIEDPSPTKFTYVHPAANGVIRAMNLTQFVGLEGSGKQLISIQSYGEQIMQMPDQCLNDFKRLGLVDLNARLLNYETYIYEQSYFNSAIIHSVKGASAIFEMINTGHIANIGSYAEKWKTVLKPLNK